ncbi:hypothetical protein ACFP53_41035, partial [Streptomyces zhihengii]
APTPPTPRHAPTTTGPADQAPGTTYALIVPGLTTVYVKATTEAAARDELALEGSDTIEFHDPHLAVGRSPKPSNPKTTDAAPPPAPASGGRGPGPIPDDDEVTALAMTTT